MSIPPPITVDSVDGLRAALRPDKIQRIDVTAAPLTYNLLTSPRRRGPLFVVLRGAEPHRDVPLPRFSRFSWRDEFPGTVVCIADPTLYFHDKLKLAWYFGTADHDAITGLCRIVEALCASFGLAIADVLFYGSSGGGFAAMQCAARLGRGATAIAINPQTDVLKFPVVASVDAFLAACAGGITRKQARQRFGARLSVPLTWQMHPAGDARCLIVQNIADRPHYRRHYRPLSRLWGLTDNERSADGRLASILYDHADGHAAEPRELVPRIIQTALSLRWSPISPPTAASA